MGSAPPSEGGGIPPEVPIVIGGAIGGLLGLGGGSEPSRRDIVRKRPVLQQLAHLQASLARRSPVKTPRKFARTERRLSGIEDLIEAARTLAIPLLSVRKTIRAVERRLGVDTGLRQIERGLAPDLSVLAAAAAATQPPAPPSPGIPPPTPRPTAPPGLPSGWWDWQFWQRALYGAASFAGLLRRQPSAGGGGTIRIVLPRAQAPAPIFTPQPAAPPGAATSLGGTMPAFSFTGSGANDSIWGNVGSGDIWGALEAGIDLAGQFFGQQAAPLVQGSRPGFLPAVLAGPVARTVLGGAAGAAGVGLLEGFFGDDSPGAPALFTASESRILPRARIDAVGPDGRCYTWFRAVPYGWKVRGTKVGGRKRHHHHYRKR